MVRFSLGPTKSMEELERCAVKLPASRPNTITSPPWLNDGSKVRLDLAEEMTCTTSFTDVPTIFAVPAIAMCDVCPEDKLVPARMAVATADAEAPVGRAVPSDPAVMALCVVENVCEPKLKFELLKTSFLGPS